MRAVDGQDLASGSPIRHHEKVDFYAQCDGKALENFKKRSTVMQLTRQSAHSYTVPTLEEAGNQEALLVIQEGAEQEDGQGQKGVEDLLLDQKLGCERKGGILCQ